MLGKSRICLELGRWGFKRKSRKVKIDRESRKISFNKKIYI